MRLVENYSKQMNLNANESQAATESWNPGRQIHLAGAIHGESDRLLYLRGGGSKLGTLKNLTYDSN